MRPLVLLLATATAALAAAAPATAQDEEERPFLIGFADSLLGGEQGPIWAKRVAASGADAARVNLYWNVVGPHQPEHPRDPADPAYDFTAIDQSVRSADAAGLEVLMTILSAPRWAEGPVRPDFVTAPPGTWRPDPEAFGDFARAVAHRYSGSYPDPLGSGTLPEVDLYSAWNEPNISAYLTPQYVDGEVASAEVYVGLLNAFGDGIRAANPDATIATGGTAPFGDPDGRRRSAPLEFWREVLCLNRDLKREGFCPDDERPRFDALAHHPITYLSSPNVPATNPDDVTVADFGKLGDLLRAAEDEGTVAPREDDRPHRLIAPEVWWETSPPERRGVSLRRQARYTALAIHLLWRKGADGVWFLQIRDAERSAGDHRLSSYQTGVFTFAGRRKPALRAIRFPFVTTRSSGSVVSAWGRAPADGRVRIRVRRPGDRWRLADSARVRAGETFTERLALKGRALVRAEVAGVRSPVWRQRR
jgi:hypothetical protein